MVAGTTIELLATSRLTRGEGTQYAPVLERLAAEVSATANIEHRLPLFRSSFGKQPDYTL
jgi:hypothetical protein